MAKAGLIAGSIGLSALVGFVASLLRRRPTTSYTTSQRQPLPSDDEEITDALDEEAPSTQGG
jgi:hypothetical protein